MDINVVTRRLIGSASAPDSERLRGVHESMRRDAFQGRIRLLSRGCLLEISSTGVEGLLVLDLLLIFLPLVLQVFGPLQLV